MMLAGTYYVGDLCYVMNNEWDEFCDITISNNHCHDGEFTLKNGVKFATYCTAYGDGCYTDQNGNEYGVDAGLIGCVLIKDLTETNPDFSGGQVIEFLTDFETSESEGVISIGHISINTAGAEYTDEDEQDDENYNDEGDDD